MPRYKRGTIFERFWAKVDPCRTDNEWRWTAATRWTGYPHSLWDNEKREQVSPSKWAYTNFVGPIPDGLLLDHICHSFDTTCKGGVTCLHRLCVNPEHLEPVTFTENVRRGRAAQATKERFALQTLCKRGHPLTIGKTQRECTICKLITQQIRRDKAKDARNRPI